MLNRNLRRTATAIGTAALGLGLAGPATAAPATTYHGFYDGVTTYAARPDGSGPCPTGTKLVVEGTWNVRVAADRSTATMSTNLFYDGAHHLAYGGVFAVQSAGDHSFQIAGEAAAEDGTPITITLTLSESGDLVYTVAPYPLFGNNCASLTLTGHEGRPAA